MIHKLAITLSSSILYCSYFVGMLSAIASQYERVVIQYVSAKISAWYVSMYIRNTEVLPNDHLNRFNQKEHLKEWKYIQS